MVEMEVRELLNKYGFPGDDTPIIRGVGQGGAGKTPTTRRQPNASTTSLRRRRVRPDADARDRTAVPDADRRRLRDQAGGTVVTGRIERGKINKGGRSRSSASPRRARPS